jgi:hypothetical protein
MALVEDMDIRLDAIEPTFFKAESGFTVGASNNVAPVRGIMVYN